MAAMKTAKALESAARGGCRREIILIDKLMPPILRIFAGDIRRASIFAT
jgi:hypothetical protein